MTKNAETYQAYLLRFRRPDKTKPWRVVIHYVATQQQHHFATVDEGINFVQSQLEPDQTHFESLTERELEVLGYLASGASNREIGQHLSIAETTVKRHVCNIFGKLNVHNRTQAALKAGNIGISPQPLGLLK